MKRRRPWLKWGVVLIALAGVVWAGRRYWAPSSSAEIDYKTSPVTRGDVTQIVTANGSLVVVRTRPGSAPAVARAVDLARLDGVLGTIAGDDTIFVAPWRERGARALAARLGSLLAAPVVPATAGGGRSPP